MSDLPCARDPEKWFSRNHGALGEAVHGCLVHCPRLAQCREEPPAVDGVIAGVLYTRLGVPHYQQPPEVKCLDCLPPPQIHGTEAGYSRHRRAREPQCTACRIAHNAAAERRRKERLPKEPEPPKDVFEERRRVLVEAMKRSA